MAERRPLVLPEVVASLGEPGGRRDSFPLQHAKLVEALLLVLPLVMLPYMIRRFHATRPLAGNMPQQGTPDSRNAWRP